MESKETRRATLVLRWSATRPTDQIARGQLGFGPTTSETPSTGATLTRCYRVAREGFLGTFGSM